MYGSGFDAWTQGYTPMAQGMPHTQLTGFEGLPFVNNPVMSTMAPFLTPTAQEWMNGMNMSPMGLTGRNVGDTMSNMAYTEHQNTVLARAAANDRASVQRTFKGMSAMAGKQWDADKQAAADSFADSYAALAPSIGMMSTDALDAVTGGTSQTGFAVGVLKGARYRKDPMTGLPGMSTDSTSHLVEGLSNLYFEGGKFDRAKNHGFTSSQMGSLYDELQRRGMIAGPGGAQEAAMGGISMLEQGDSANFNKIMTQTLGSERASAVMASARSAGTSATSQLSKAELEKLAGTQEGTDSIKALDVTKVKASLDKYSKLTAAMRDIFGDAGRPDAPMAELVKGLEAMTNGSLQHMDPGRAEMMIRQTYALAKSSGVGLEGAMIMQQHGAQLAQQLGLPPSAAVQLGQVGLAGLQAAQQSGMGGLNQWGAMNSEQMAQALQTRTARARGSEIANRIGALDQLNERLKGANGTGFGEDSNIGKMLAAAKDGRTTFEYTDKDGKTTTRSIRDFTSQENMGALASEVETSSGGLLSRRDLDQQQRNRFANQQTLDENAGINTAVGQLSSEETGIKTVGRKITNDLRTRFEGRGTAEERDELGRKIGLYMEGATGTKEEKTKAIADMMRESGLTTGMSDQQIAMAAGAQLTIVDNARADAGLMNQTANAQLNNEEFRGDTTAAMFQATIAARRNSALTGIGQNTGMVTRLVQAVQRQGDEPPDPDALKKVLAEMVGGVNNEEVANALRGPLSDFAAAQAHFEKQSDELSKLGIEEQILPTDTPEEKRRKEESNRSRKEAKKQYDQSAAQLGAAKDTLHGQMRKFEGVSAALDGATPAQQGAEAEKETPEPTTSASAGEQRGPWTMEGTLIVKSDGTGTLQARGAPRGAVPTGVNG